MSQEKILNKGLELALEFGPTWLQPIQSRLSDRFPELTSEELNKYDSICRTAMKIGNNFIYKTLVGAAEQNGKIKQREMAEKLKAFLDKEYPWIDSENVKRILSQGFYYAWKDGLNKYISG